MLTGEGCVGVLCVIVRGCAVPTKCTKNFSDSLRGDCWSRSDLSSRLYHCTALSAQPSRPQSTSYWYQHLNGGRLTL